MASQKRKGRRMILLKSLILFITCLSFVGILSCNRSGTNSTGSSSSNSGTNTDWNITIQVGTNPIRFGETTTVLAIVKDNTGAPAPIGTNVCMTAVKNGFIQGKDLFATICSTTTNNLGQSIQTYSASVTTGEDIVEVTSQRVIATKIITVTN
jgi:hypothetical protein